MSIGSVLHGLAGVAVLTVAYATGEVLSIGGLLGTLLLLSAGARYFKARGV